MLAVPATAAAAGPTASSSPANAQYASGPSPSGGSAGGSATASGGGSLPFTGFDAGLLAAIGVGLVASGALLHRRQRTSGEQA